MTILDTARIQTIQKKRTPKSRNRPDTGSNSIQSTKNKKTTKCNINPKINTI